MMKLHTFKTAYDFLKESETILEKEEASNNLMLGLAYSLAENPQKYGTDPFFAIVEKSGSPELFVLRTPPMKLIIFAPQKASTEACGHLASYFASANEQLPGVIGPSDVAQEFADVYTTFPGCRVTLSMKMRIYKLTDVIEPEMPAGAFRPAEAKDIPVLNDWIDAFHTDVFKDRTNVAKAEASDLIKKSNLFAWDDSGIISMAARTRPTRNGYVLAYVYTPNQSRNKGYGTAVASSLCRHILSSGKSFCSLFADLANPISNSIYQKIGFKPVRDFYDFSFEYKKS
jgi:uncharacterized protein